VSLGDQYGSSLSGSCLSLLEYLKEDVGAEPRSQTQGNISAAMDSIWACASILVDHGFAMSTAYEHLLNFGSMLLYFHTTRGLVRYHDVRLPR
jgi:hypothetical protein